MRSTKCRVPGLRIGCTSFIIPDDYVPAVSECVRYADDIALLLLEAGQHGAGLISRQEVSSLADIAEESGTTWNVHLPTDGNYSTPYEADKLTDNILRAIDLTRPLSPHTWVMHVVTNHVPSHICQPPLTPQQTDRILHSLARIAGELPAPEFLALENLESHPLDYLDRILSQTPYSRCFDIGHVWKDHLLPEALLPQWLPTIRMCHLHGLAERDHKSLCHMPPERLDAILFPLWDCQFTQTITLEVFTLNDFLTSHQAMLDSYARYQSHR